MRGARQAVSDAERRRAAPPPPALAGVLAQQLAVGQTAEELAKLDQRACPVCGITFFEFRNQGRLGCPHDYVCFEKELEPLIVNIHGETRARRQAAARACGAAPTSRRELIRLRREMKEAIDKEEYERASQLRDEIRQLEDEDAAAGRPEDAEPPAKERPAQPNRMTARET